MKKKFLIFITSLTILSSSSLWGLIVGEDTITSSTDDELVSYAIITHELEEDYPQWTPESKAEIPLSQRKAIQIAKKEILENLEIEGDWTTAEIKLTRFIPTQKWYYVITMVYQDIKVTNSEKVKNEGVLPAFDSTVKFIQIPVYLNGRIPTSSIQNHNQSQ
jgi:hypothetical protein